jgi:3-phosphoshikimate 1-carboxyvinyltransferase
MTSQTATYFFPNAVLNGTTTVPGDKSISHRSLMLSTQALGNCKVYGLLEGADVMRTMASMRQLGAVIEKRKDHWLIQGKGLGSLMESEEVLDLGNAGTGVRLLMGLVASYPFTTVFTGDESLRSRPMGRVLDPLREMGAAAHCRSGNRLPCTLIGGRLKPITYTLPVASAQVKSAILLAALNTPGTTTVIEEHPSRDHTEAMLCFFGFDCQVKRDGARHIITLQGGKQGKSEDRTIIVPGDPSSAAFPIIAALISPKSEVTITNIGMNPLRTGLFTTLKEMGADLHIHNERHSGGELVADITAKSSKLKGVEVPAERAPSMIDEYPILAMAAAVAEGVTSMRGLAELRVKESNRLEKVANGLRECGADVTLERDDLIVRGKPSGVAGGVCIDSALDHRIAMSFLILGLRAAKPIEVTGTDTIATSFPGFFKTMSQLGVKLHREAHTQFEPALIAQIPPLKIAIDGPAASGKGTLARRLADTLKFTYLDTGSLYRAVGLKLVYNEQDPHNEKEAVAAAKTIELQDLSNPRLRQEHIGQAASIVSAIPAVRQTLLDFQRKTAADPRGAVLDGRDIGTVVCPDADLKLFITADLETRAKRRHRELQGEGIEVVYSSVLEDLIERDERDMARDAAPLKPAPDALTIDTSDLEADAVFVKVMEKLIERYADRRKARVIK